MTCSPNTTNTHHPRPASQGYPTSNIIAPRTLREQSHAAHPTNHHKLSNTTPAQPGKPPTGRIGRHALRRSLLNSTAIRLALRDRRKQLGWSQQELAKRPGVHQPLISRIETGKSASNLQTILVLAHTLDLRFELREREATYADRLGL